MQIDDNLTVQRRNYLKGTSSAFLLGLTPGMINTKPSGESISLVKTGIKIEENLGGGHHIPLPDHKIHDDKLILYKSNDLILDKIKENEILAYAFEEDSENRYQELPTTLLTNKSRRDLTTKLSGALTPLNLMSVVKSVPFPQINVKNVEGQVRVQSGGRQVDLKPDEDREIKIEPKDVTLPPSAPDGKPHDARVTPIVIARQTKELEVELFENIGEHKTPPDPST